MEQEPILGSDLFGRQILTEKQEAIVAILSKPKFEYMGGKLRPWDEAMLHIGCEAVTRGLNVFEGIRGFWQSRIVNPSLPF